MINLQLKTGIIAGLAGLLLFPSLPAFADTLIVGNKREHTVSFIDLKTGDEIRRVTTGKAPHEVAVSPDGSTAVIVSYRDRDYMGSSLHVFDIATGEKLRVVEMDGYTAPHGLKWIGEGRTVAVTTEGSKHLVIANVDSGKVEAAIPTNQKGSHMVVLSPDQDRAYVANIQSGSFSVIDLESQKRLKNVKAGKGTEAITMTPDGSELWVGNNNSRNIIVFDPLDFKKLATIETKGVPIRVEISPDGKHAAVSEADLNAVTIIDVKTREVVASIDMSEAGGKVPVTLLFDQTGPRLWAATTQAARVIEINTADWTINRHLEAGAGSDGLGYSPIDLIGDVTEETSKPEE